MLQSRRCAVARTPPRGLDEMANEAEKDECYSLEKIIFIGILVTVAWLVSLGMLSSLRASTNLDADKIANEESAVASINTNKYKKIKLKIDLRG
jgi:hypothetical protein